MQKKILIGSLFVSLVFLVVFVGCSKSSSPTGGGNTNADSVFITTATWVYSTSGIDANDDGTIDAPDNSVTACQKDNIYTFGKDSTGVMDEGATKCNSTDPQTDPFSWYLMTSNNQKFLHITSNTILNGSLNLLTLNATSLVVYKDTTIVGVPVRYVVMFKH